ncbi:potassium-transporting ATPase subunit KdpC [Bordetella pertussis]|uniref:Potassium-transporting ATPase KdpC subunit n=35 Tax=Bordetella TaxID=517 RepID=A0A0T7CMY7_BORP1|nr:MULTISPECIES: potassium-transporting ATPase subunit KdpC [Bordetella]AEE67720.1 potassium-transporting ATPase subunit C [Bordetella pertussis CS]AIW91813.1 potassium-transporting ATPase subunit C [Bordetella pertussis B1917]AIW95309.1 potassium-transporting ATPase subunit C [Bordetella pertussis B1920]AJB26777.1 potassium-transporting ATPase subunit C [Bordetella pertussis 137]ALH48864.1 potassium-transporting ATPase subunit C [Bordetella pertussis]
MTMHPPLPPAGRPLRAALVIFLALSVLVGLLYPLATTGVARLLWPFQAGGSLLEQDGRVVGSALIGQSFTDPRYFWGRPSATAPMPYNAAASGGSNLGPANPALAQAVRARIAALRAADPGNPAPIPVDLATASGSGLDPHISPAAAGYQAARVARARGLPTATVEQLIARHTERPVPDILGEPVVNVLALNLALDRLR